MEHTQYVINNITLDDTSLYVYAELKQVSEIMVQSFYADNTNFSLLPVAAILKIGEWNRLQQNFPYAADRCRHIMLVVLYVERTIAI
jgi:hypothetical protein